VRRALLFTAFDRPHYLRPVVDAWRRVPGLQDWHVRAAVEPGPLQDEVADLLRELPGTEVVVNEERLGVSRNPHRHLDALFADGFDFVARTEDDLLVADDVLALLEHCADAFRDAADVAAVCAYSPAPAGADPAAVRRTTAFSPWLWGTWRETWTDLIGPTWDLDYSTWNGSPGFESGWDWNLNTRVLPRHGLTTVAPLASRVQNIGVVGQHGTASNHETAASFRASFGRPAYRYVE
jgi:hypothetical protein